MGRQRRVGKGARRGAFVCSNCQEQVEAEARMDDEPKHGRKQQHERT
jgi:hypothetical protein